MGEARKPLALVAAMTPSRVIGKGGKLPWHLPEDLAHFRRVTHGHAVIMGRLTYESVGVPLKGRRTIVVSRDRALWIEGCEVAPSLDAAIARARETDPEPQILGGAQIYAEALPLATRLVLTYLDDEHEGDAFFPAFDANDWVEAERRRGERCTFVTLRRRTTA